MTLSQLVHVWVFWALELNSYPKAWKFPSQNPGNWRVCVQLLLIISDTVLHSRLSHGVKDFFVFNEKGSIPRQGHSRLLLFKLKYGLDQFNTSSSAHKFIDTD